MRGSAVRLRRGLDQVSTPAPLSDGVLIQQARQGDDQAFRHLVERYEGRVAATVVGMLGPGQEAEDAGQETFIRFYRSLDRYRGDAALGTYLTRIAINLSLTALKRRKSSRRLFVEADDVTEPRDPETLDAHDQLEARLRAERVRKAIEMLKPPQRAVVVLRMIDGYSTRETGGILGVPPGTVMSRLSRAMKNLEQLLEGDDEP